MSDSYLERYFTTIPRHLLFSIELVSSRTEIHSRTICDRRLSVVIVRSITFTERAKMWHPSSSLSWKRWRGLTKGNTIVKSLVETTLLRSLTPSYVQFDNTGHFSSLLFVTTSYSGAMTSGPYLRAQTIYWRDTGIWSLREEIHSQKSKCFTILGNLEKGPNLMTLRYHLCM